MMLRIVLPSQTVFEEEVDKVVAPGRDGYFGILPRHVDAVFSLRSGILSLWQQGRERYFAVNEGFLVKQQDRLEVACLRAVEGASLARLQRTLVQEMTRIDETERQAREVLIKLEMDTMKRFVDLED